MPLSVAYEVVPFLYPYGLWFHHPHVSTTEPMTLELIKAAALLLALSLLQGINARLLDDRKTIEKIVSGCLFGGICVIGMMAPIELAPGVIFDARSVVLSMAGLFGGPIVGIIAATIAGGYRLLLGGGGAQVGLAVVISSVLLGLAYGYCRNRGWVKVGIPQLLAFGLLVHVVEVLWFTQLPAEVVQTVMENVALPLIVTFTPATALLGLILQDIERRFETECSLKKSKARLSHHIENTPLGAVSWDENFHCTEWNKAAERIFGYTSDEAIGQPAVKLVIPAAIEEDINALYKTLMNQKGGARSTNENITKDGRTIICDWYNTPIIGDDGQVIGVTSLVQNITERVLAEEELRTTRQRAENILEGAADAIISVNKDQKIISFNKSAEEIFGYTKDEAIGMPLELMMPKDIRKKHNNHFRNFGDSDLGARWMGKRKRLHGLRKSGELFTASVSISKQNSSSGPIFTAIIKDTSKAVKAENALRESEREFCGIFDNLQDVFYRTDLNGRVVMISPSVEDIFGYKPEELINSKMANFYVNPNDRNGFLDDLEAGGGNISGFETDMRHSDGHVVKVSTSAHLYMDNDGNVAGVEGITRDISEQKMAELQLIQSSKLATLGEMATGMAHELNQPLNIIRMTTELLQESSEDGGVSDEVLVDKLGRIMSQVDRASEIINHMRIFGRNDTGRLESIDIKEALLGAIGLVRDQLRLSEIELITDIPDTCRNVLGHGLQVEQVILNLLINSRDAINEQEDGGTGLKQIKATITDDLKSDKVKLIFQDTGGGIPDKILNRIFEPFFTTKSVGQGTGLGLSISYGIITEMGGEIKASNVDGGAEFTISLRAASNKT